MAQDNERDGLVSSCLDSWSISALLPNRLPRRPLLVVSHPFDKYLQKHGHGPRLRVDNGSQRLQVTFSRGYVKIDTYPWGGSIYITRSALIKLLTHPSLKPLIQKMEGDFDVPQAMRQAYLRELELLEENRRLKRARRGSKRKLRKLGR